MVIYRHAYKQVFLHVLFISFYIAEYFCILPKAIYLIKVALCHDLARYDDT